MNTITLHHGKAAKNTTIEWVHEIWYSDSVFINQMILNSFNYVGISSELDKSEDHQFRCYEELEKETKQ